MTVEHQQSSSEVTLLNPVAVEEIRYFFHESVVSFKKNFTSLLLHDCLAYNETFSAVKLAARQITQYLLCIKIEMLLQMQKIGVINLWQIEQT